MVNQRQVVERTIYFNCTFVNAVPFCCLNKPFY